MERKGAGTINFNFTQEQQERFNLLWAETKKVHPNLTEDPVMKEKARVILAYHIINENKTNNKNDNDNDNEVYVEEIKDEVINKDNDTE